MSEEETIPQMRDSIEALKKEGKAKDAEIARLGKDLRVRDAREAFRTAGYNPKHGDLFASSNPEGDITPEGVAKFADEWDLQPASVVDGSDEGGSTSDEDDDTSGFTGMSRSGTRTGEGGGGSSTDKVLTRQEWMELNATDPVAASQALSQGRVLISSSGNLKAGQSVNRGGNPYEPQLAE